MLDEEIDYRVPIRLTRERAAGAGFSKEGFHLFENYESLTTGVERFATDYAWAEDPPARTRRFAQQLPRLRDRRDRHPPGPRKPPALSRAAGRAGVAVPQRRAGGRSFVIAMEN